jgi:hypothetical protein
MSINRADVKEAIAALSADRSPLILRLSKDTKPEVNARELAAFVKQVQRMLQKKDCAAVCFAETARKF